MDNSGEKVAFLSHNLLKFFEKKGFSHYKTRSFERYDLFREYVDFLPSSRMITFSDTDGTLMALNPDVTISLMQNAEFNPEELSEFYYNEDVWRVSPFTGKFKRYRQLGVECLGSGKKSKSATVKVISMAAECLNTVSGLIQDNQKEASNSDKGFTFCIAESSLLQNIISSLTLNSKEYRAILADISKKNTSSLSANLKSFGVGAEKIDALLTLLQTPSYDIDTQLLNVQNVQSVFGLKKKSKALEDIVKSFKDTEFYNHLRIDFSITRSLEYYSGLVFTGFINSFAEPILSGGEYSRLLQKLEKGEFAIGFSINREHIVDAYSRSIGGDVC